MQLSGLHGHTRPLPYTFVPGKDAALYGYSGSPIVLPARTLPVLRQFHDSGSVQGYVSGDRSAYTPVDVEFPARSEPATGSASIHVSSVPQFLMVLTCATVSKHSQHAQSAPGGVLQSLRHLSPGNLAHSSCPPIARQLAHHRA